MENLISAALTLAFGHQPAEIGPLQIFSFIILVIANLYILAALMLGMRLNKIAESKALSKII